MMEILEKTITTKVLNTTTTGILWIRLPQETYWIRLPQEVKLSSMLLFLDIFVTNLVHQTIIIVVVITGTNQKRTMNWGCRHTEYFVNFKNTVQVELQFTAIICHGYMMPFVWWSLKTKCLSFIIQMGYWVST
jgi:hypothetical protein